MLALLAEAAIRSIVLGGAVWAGLKLLRAQNPHVQMSAWIMVLIASLAMPLLMHWVTVPVTVSQIPPLAPGSFWPVESSPPAPPAGMPAAPEDKAHWAIVWGTLATAVYACVAVLMLFRLAIGLHLTRRLARAAKPVRESYTDNSDVRVSSEIDRPVTFGSIILVPSEWIDWDWPKRRAVLAHERAHVASRDFYWLLLASLNRAVFWFSPFAWWQLHRLAELAEIISDIRAMEVLDDRLSYAEILLDLAQNVQSRVLALEMAKASTVRARLERILGAAKLPPRVGWRKRMRIAAAIMPIVMVSAGSIAYRTEPAGAFAVDGPGIVAASKPQAVDFYSVGPTSVFAIFREGDRLYGQMTEQRKLRLSVVGDGTYSYAAAGGEITFALDPERESSELELRQNGRDLRAVRIAAVLRASADSKAMHLDEYVGWYELAPSRALRVTRAGERIHVRETGRAEFQVMADAIDTFSASGEDLIVFLRDAEGRVTKALIEDPMFGPRLFEGLRQTRRKPWRPTLPGGSSTPRIDSETRFRYLAARTKFYGVSRTSSAVRRTMTT